MEDGFHKVSKQKKIIIHRRLGDVEIEQIKKCKNYTEISLWHIKQKDLNFLSCLPNLTAIEFYGSEVDDFAALTKAENLERVFLNRIKKQEDVSFIGQLTQIKELDLMYLSKLEKFPDLSACKKLKRLRIWNCNKLFGIENIAAIPNLEEIDIVETPQKPGDLEFLIKLPNMKYFSAQFGGVKMNTVFDELLLKYGKLKHKI